MILKLLILITCSLTTKVFADITKPCHFSGLENIKRPWYPNKNKSFEFLYSFRVLRTAKKGFPTIIFIPGGPGQTSMDGQLGIDKIVPKNWGLVLTDPRGVGCNDVGKEYPPDFFQTNYIADDILALIKKIAIPHDKIILYGLSYGTVVATKVASLANKRELTKFNALFLEGTLGRSFKGQEFLDQYVIEWREYFNRLDELTKQMLIKNFPLLSRKFRKNWSNFLLSGLIFGGAQKREHTLDYPISLLSSNEGILELEKNFLITGERNSSQNSNQMWESIWCGELNNEGNTWELGYDIDFNALRIYEKKDRTLCNTNYRGERYDSSFEYVREKVFYFQGGADPATPLWQAEYHFENLNGSGESIFFTFPEMGHSPLEVLKMFESTCLSDFLNSVLSEKNTNQILEKCGFNVRTKYKKRNPNERGVGPS